MEAFNVKFVGEVEKYPELYNYTLPAYSKRDATEKAWGNIAEEVNLSVNECKEKWRNLRTTFVRHLKPKPSGSGATKKNPYYLMDAMQFAVPYVKVVGNPTGNLPEPPQIMLSSTTSTAEIGETDPLEECTDITEEMLNEPGNCLPFASFPALISTPPSTNQGGRVATPPSEATTTTRGPHGQPTRKRKIANSDAADKAITAYFSAKQAKLSNPLPPKNIEDKREEGIKNFLTSLIPDLIQLSDVQLRSYKRRTLLLIDEVGGSSTDFPQSCLNTPSDDTPTPQKIEQ